MLSTQDNPRSSQDCNEGTALLCLSEKHLSPKRRLLTARKSRCRSSSPPSGTGSSSGHVQRALTLTQNSDSKRERSSQMDEVLLTKSRSRSQSGLDSPVFAKSTTSSVNLGKLDEPLDNEEESLCTEEAIEKQLM